jgi:hypothetical protein
MTFFSNGRTIPLDNITRLSLFERENRSIIGSFYSDTHSESILTVAASKCTLRCFLPFALVALTTGATR